MLILANMKISAMHVFFTRVMQFSLRHILISLMYIFLSCTYFVSNMKSESWKMRCKIIQLMFEELFLVLIFRAAFGAK